MKQKRDLNELIEKYHIDLKKLEEEQIKLAKNISIKDSINFDVAERIAGIENVFHENKIISAIVVLQNNELVEQEYVLDSIKFPYIPGFRAYRELPTMVAAFSKLDEKPDLVFLKGNGILHPRNLGIASHFSLAANIPAIGIADSLILGELKNENIFLGKNMVGKVIDTKQGANPIYVSPGNMISIDTAFQITKKLTTFHKLPEPLRLAKKYAREILKEIYKSS